MLTSFTVSAATRVSEQSVKQTDSSIRNIESMNRYTDAVNQYLTTQEGVYMLSDLAKDTMTPNDYALLKNIVEDLNNPIATRSSRANSFRLTLSNQEATYNLGKATGAAGIIAIIAGLGGITAILSVAVAIAGITAGGLANQINYRNNGNGVTLDVSLTGIVVKSR